MSSSVELGYLMDATHSVHTYSQVVSPSTSPQVTIAVPDPAPDSKADRGRDLKALPPTSTRHRRCVATGPSPRSNRQDGTITTFSERLPIADLQKPAGTSSSEKVRSMGIATSPNGA